jgi:hypothetical protein
VFALSVALQSKYGHEDVLFLTGNALFKNAANQLVCFVPIAELSIKPEELLPLPLSQLVRRV